MPRKKYWKKGLASKQRSEECNLVKKGTKAEERNLVKKSSKAEECNLVKKCTAQSKLPKQSVKANYQSQFPKQPVLDNCESKLAEYPVSANSQNKSPKRPVSTNCQSKFAQHPVKANCQRTLAQPNVKAKSSSHQESFTAQGSFHQADTNIFEEGGTQCVANSCMSILYDQVKGVAEWQTDDLDQILLTGNRLYQSIQLSSTVNHRLLLVSELPECLEVMNQTFELKRGESLIGNLAGNDDLDPEFGAVSLDNALSRALETHDSCFVTFADSTFSVIHRQNSFYMFDPHSRNKDGLRIPDGKSVVTKHSTVNELHDRILMLAESMMEKDNLNDTQFEVTGMNVLTQNAQNDKNADVTFVANERNLPKYKPLSFEDCSIICENLGIPNSGPNTLQIADTNENEEISEPCRTQPIAMDGNCFFRALSFAVSGSEDHHSQIRDLVVDHMLNNMQLFTPYLRPHFASVEQYISQSGMRNLNTWATEIEIMGAADLFGCHIFTYTERWLRYPCSEREEQLLPMGGIYLKHCNGSHYEFVKCVLQGSRTCDKCWETTKKQCEKNDKSDSHSNEDESSDDYNAKCKLRYQENKEYREIKKSFALVRYELDQEVLKKTNAKNMKSRYQEDVEYRQRERDRTKRRYEEGENTVLLKEASKQKYARNEVHKEYVKAESKRKYAEDETHRLNVRAMSRRKYQENENHKENVKTLSRRKYKEDELHRQSVRLRSKRKYAENDDHRSKVMKLSIQKYERSEKHRVGVKQTIRLKRTKQKLDRYHIDKVTNIFREKISQVPDHICSVCHRMLFPNQVLKCKPDMYTKKGPKIQTISKKCISRKYFHLCSENCDKPCVHRNHPESKLWICHTCHRKVLSGRMPAEAAANNLHLEDIPPELSCLNPLEQHLICKHIPFAKVAQLPKGQLGICGPMVCVPSNIEKSANVLPRSDAEDQLIRVKLKRKLSYKGSYQDMFVSKAKIQAALENLMKHNKFYDDVSYNDKWINTFNKLSDNKDSKQTTANTQTYTDRKCPDETSKKQTRKETKSCQGEKFSEDSLLSVADHDENNGNVTYNDSWVNTFTLMPDKNCTGDQTTDSSPRKTKRTCTEESKSICQQKEKENMNAEDDTLPDLIQDDTLPDLTLGPEAAMVEEQVESEECVEHGMYMDSCLQPIDIGQEILDQHFDKIVTVAPAEGNDPIQILMDETNEGKSFPVLFPSGQPTYHDSREEKITISRYLHTRLMLADGRFAKSTDYIFYAQYLSEVYQVLSSVSIAARKSFFGASGAKVSSEKLLDKDSLNTILKADDGFKFLSGIRGTPSFWSAAQKDLFAMLRQLGIPTWFCSFSAGDMRWREVVEALMRYEGDNRNADELTWIEKCGLLRRNPVLAARMFDHRFHCFLKDVIMSPANPIGPVIDYFYRVEFQQRGSPHTHCLFWVENAPKLNEDTDDDILEFIDKYVSCEIPDSDDEELHEIVTSVQKHSTRHSKSCRKQGTKCRFGFPRPPSTRSFISQPSETDEVVDPSEQSMKTEEAKEILQKVWNAIDNKEANYETTEDLFSDIGISQEMLEEACGKVTRKASVTLERNIPDVWVNQYNADLLRCWNANMDIQFVLDAYSCIVYIISYISKSEREMGVLLDHARQEALKGNPETKKAMKKLGSVYLHNREVSAQEAVYRVCNLNLKECSRKVQFIPVGDNVIKMSLPLKVLQNKCKSGEIDSEELWMTSIVDRYLNRPVTDEFDEMCLATFCSEYRVLSKSEISESRTHRTPVFELQKGLGHIQKRSNTKPAVVRYAKFPLSKEPEKHFQSQLQLFLPHRSLSQLKPEPYESYENVYTLAAVKLGNHPIEPVKNIVDRNKALYETDSEEIERAAKVLESAGTLEDAWSQLCPESEVERLAAPKTKPTKCPGEHDDTDIPDLFAEEKRSYLVEIAQYIIPQHEARNLLQSLNIKQRQVFYQIRQWCLDERNGNKPQPIHVFVTGGAGTGKSHLIKTVQYEAHRLLAPIMPHPDDVSVLLTAPTGVAAFNINASTIHSTFAIGIDAKLPYQPLGEEKINALRSKLGSLKLLIIDEISMVDHKLLTYIHGRLRQIKQCRDYSPFGNVSVLAVGDFYQLSPVKGKSLYSSTEGVNLWADNFGIVELDQIMRQRDSEFAETLNNLRTRQKTEDLKVSDVNLLKERETGEENDAIHIFATNAQVDEYNTEKLHSTCSNPVSIKAEDLMKDTKSGTMKMRDKQYIKVFNTNLARTIYLAVGARVMLTKNLDVSDGLVNGVFGTVSYIEQETDTFPSKVFVVFDNDKVGQNLRRKSAISPLIPAKSTPISPSEDRVNSSGGIRKQFPLKLSFACTVHKLQGITLNQAVVSLDKIFAAGQAYVALSRVSSLQGLVIKDFSETVIYCNEKVSTALSEMPSFLNGHVYEPSKCILVLHNVQGLKSHIKDVRTEKYGLDPTFICLTETWLSYSEQDTPPALNGYAFHHRSRYESYDSSHDLKLQAHGGVGVYSKSNIPCDVFPLRVSNLEHISFYAADCNIVVVVIYRPGSLPMKEFSRSLLLLVKELTKTPGGYIIMGDFNENYLQAPAVSNLMLGNGFEQHVKEATTENGTIIDHVYIKGVSNVKVRVIPTYFSYHEGIGIFIE